MTMAHKFKRWDSWIQVQFNVNAKVFWLELKWIEDGEISLSSPAPPPWSSSSTVVCSRGRGCSKACDRSQGQGHNAETGCSLGPLCHGAPCNHPLFAYWTRSLRSARERRYYSLANTKSNAEKNVFCINTTHTHTLFTWSLIPLAMWPTFTLGVSRIWKHLPSKSLI